MISIYNERVREVAREAPVINITFELISDCILGSYRKKTYNSLWQIKIKSHSVKRFIKDLNFKIK